MSKVSVTKGTIKVVFELTTKEDIEAMKQMGNFYYQVSKLVGEQAASATVTESLAEILAKLYDELDSAGA